VLCYHCTNSAVQRFAFTTPPDNNPVNSRCLELRLFLGLLSLATLALLSHFSLSYRGQCSQQQQKSFTFLGDLFVQHAFCLSIPSNAKVCVRGRGEAPVLPSEVDDFGPCWHREGCKEQMCLVVPKLRACVLYRAVSTALARRVLCVHTCFD